MQTAVWKLKCTVNQVIPFVTLPPPPSTNDSEILQLWTPEIFGSNTKKTKVVKNTTIHNWDWWEMKV